MTAFLISEGRAFSADTEQQKQKYTHSTPTNPVTKSPVTFNLKD